MWYRENSVWRPWKFVRQNGGRFCAKGTTIWPPKLRCGSPIRTPHERRSRHTVANSSARVSGVYQSGRALPVVPLVLPRRRRSRGTSPATNASDRSRYVAFSSMGIAARVRVIASSGSLASQGGGRSR